MLENPKFGTHLLILLVTCCRVIKLHYPTSYITLTQIALKLNINQHFNQYQIVVMIRSWWTFGDYSSGLSCRKTSITKARRKWLIILKGEYQWYIFDIHSPRGLLCVGNDLIRAHNCVNPIVMRSVVLRVGRETDMGKVNTPSGNGRNGKRKRYDKHGRWMQCVPSS